VRERDASVSVLRAAPVIRYPWKDIGRWPVRCDRLRASLAQLAPSFALLDERAILAYQIGRAIARLRTRARIAPLPSILSRAFPAEPSRGGGMGLGWGGAAIFPGTICAPRLVISRSSPGRSRGNTAVDIPNIRTSDAICIARAEYVYLSKRAPTTSESVSDTERGAYSARLSGLSAPHAR
jgi:hypothetical protein